MSQLRIPDVSRWQGTIDWDALKASGQVDGVVIKVSGADGGACYTDGMAARNIAEARRVGLPRWFYHYKGQGVSMEDQVTYFLHAIGGLQPGEGVVTDDEDEAKVDTSESAGFSDEVKKQTGLTTVVYSNLGRFQGVDLSPLKSRGCPAWVAKYGANDGSIAGAGTAPGGIDLNIIMWQYTSQARLPGISANTVDMSLFYGDLNAFNALGAPGTIPAPASPPTAAPVAQGNGYYTVVSGDTLSGIAPKVGMGWQQIAALNGIFAPYTIFPGQKLKVFGGTLTAQKATVSAEHYTVVSGDTLSGIQTKTGVAWHTIADLNGIKSPYTIYPGQILALGGSANTTEETYTVQSGDYLSAIGAKTGRNWQAIASLNGIGAPYTIYPNQVLRLP